jgi:D-arabinose 1-dehydrogenase-like Zn-dependent alcohol dehydrogenase
MAEIIDIRNKLKVKVWKKFKLNEVRSAIESIFSKDRDGRILLEINQP